MSRRRFLASLGIAGSSLAWGKGVAIDPAGARKIIHEGMRILVQTSFEKGQFLFEKPGVTAVEGTARTGRRALKVSLDGLSKEQVLEIPVALKKGSWLYVQLYLLGNREAACRLSIAEKDRETPFTPQLKIPIRDWKIVEGFYPAKKDTKGTVRIRIARSGEASADPGGVWLDDLSVTAFDAAGWPEAVQGFPALACDAAGRVWTAALERRPPRSFIRLYRMDGEGMRAACIFEPEGLTGLGAPVLSGRDRGCLAAFPVEQEDRWRIAFAFVEEDPGKAPGCRFLDAPGTIQTAPAVAAAGGHAWIAWESNGRGRRTILACRVDPEGAGKIHTLSSPDADSHNPALAALEDGTLFAAWDSVREGHANLYGAWFRDGRWDEEHRLTHDTRIERHPALAVRNDEVWMAWQAQSYPGRKINRFEEQRIAVARIDDQGLSMPLGLFETVSRSHEKLLRPRLAFDPRGRLWLTVRKSMHYRYGWQAMAWCYTGSTWRGPRTLMPLQGRWHPVEIAWTPKGLAAAVQYDNLPHAWDHRGKNPDWCSAAALLPLWEGTLPPADPPRTTPLVMPPSSFSLPRKTADINAGLPRQHWKRGDKELHLFFGDFHEHSAFSVCARGFNPPACDLYANERDIEKLDFCALTDHGFDMDRPTWLLSGELARRHHDPGRFVTFLGQEWTSSTNPPANPGEPCRYGHHNLIFLNPYHPRFYDAFDGNISPADLWERLEGVEFLCIPHQLADWAGKGKYNPPTDWRYVNEKLQPLAEIFQKRQSYEYLGCPRQAPKGTPFRGYYLQDAWAKGVIIGVIASPDHGGGLGKIGVWAEALTRESLFEALRARHTFGTSGAKLALRFRAGDAIMGDTVGRGETPLSFEVHALAAAPIKEIVIFRNNRIAYRTHPGAKEWGFEWEDHDPPRREMLWYYARIHAENDEMAWSSPIWFLR